jgi:hypothetical protein
MKAFSLLTVLALAMPASAAEPESWQFVYVSRSSDLTVTTGQASLSRNGSHLAGTLVGEHDVTFALDVRISGESASATFGSLESDDDGTRMQGTFRQSAMPAPGGSKCWQTFQLSDGFSSLALARNVPRCEP